MRAVDTHVHVPRKEGLNEYTIEDGLRRFFKIKNKSFSIEEMANMYRQWDIIGVVFSVDTKTNMGDLPDTCLLYTSPSPRDATLSRMPSSA